MEQVYQKRVLAMASASAREHGKTGDLNSIVADLKVRHARPPLRLVAGRDGIWCTASWWGC